MASSFQLLSDDTWTTLSSTTRRHKQIHAAISYVTEDHIAFKENDILICDASDRAIRGGLTTAKTLAKFHKDGAALYSLQGLHAKIAVIDGKAFIGSANMSDNACTNTKEASLFTDNVQIAGLANKFIVDVINDKQTVAIDDAFIERIKKIKVKRFPFIGRRGKKGPKREGPHRPPTKARAWFMHTVPFSAAQIEAEAEIAPALAERAAKKLKVNDNKKLSRLAKSWMSDPKNLSYLRFSNKSSVAKNVTPGDQIVICEESPSGKTSKVWAPATCLYKEIDGKFIRLCYEFMQGEHSHAWSRVEKQFARIGVHNFTKTSNREIKGRAVDILDYLKTKQV